MGKYADFGGGGFEVKFRNLEFRQRISMFVVNTTLSTFGRRQWSKR